MSATGGKTPAEGSTPSTGSKTPAVGNTPSTGSKTPTSSVSKPATGLAKRGEEDDFDLVERSEENDMELVERGDEDELELVERDNGDIELVRRWRGGKAVGKIFRKGKGIFRKKGPKGGADAATAAAPSGDSGSDS